MTQSIKKYGRRTIGGHWVQPCAFTTGIQEPAIPAFSIPIPILRLFLPLVDFDTDTDTRKRENFDSDSDTDTKVKQVL